MDSPLQITQQIRFALDTLGENNGHHEFEKICFAFGRRRISLNLLPATGPVSSGGDQGRDSETFWSNLPNELPDTSVHLTRISTHTVAVACTIQKTKVASKVRSDLKSILGQGTSIDKVLFFTVAPVPVATRHALIQEAKDKYSVELEIFDGAALADQLSEPDLYWIAAEYLKLPLSLAPERPNDEIELPAWYLRDREIWRTRTEPGRTLGDFVSLKDILRHATFHDNARLDVGDWIAKMREFLHGGCPPDVQMRAQYEVAVATLRGTGTLIPADDLFRDFFSQISEGGAEDLALLEDAVILLTYGYGARIRGNTEIKMQELDDWYAQLQATASSALSASPYPNAKATLLAIAVRLALFPDYPKNIPERIEGLPTPQESLQKVLKSQAEDIPVAPPTDAVPVRDLDGGMHSLQDLLMHLPNAPTFPIEHTADLFEFCTLSLAEHPLYEVLRDGLDEAVARIEGDSAKAARAKARAHKFLEVNQALRALAEVHAAKINWWHGETLDESIPMMLLAASIYEHLGLFYAAKLHALSAAVAAQRATDTSLRAYVPRALVAAAAYESEAGNWCTSSRLFRIGLLAHTSYAEEPGDFERHEYLQQGFARESFALQVARDFAPDYEHYLRANAQESKTEEFLDQLIAETSDDESWNLETLLASLDRQRFGRPFNDAGGDREQSWSVFGATWTVRSASSRTEILAAERLISAIQIIQAELAEADAEWLPAQVDIEVRLDGTATRQGCERLPDNSVSRWIVHLAPVQAIAETDFLPALVSIVAGVLLEHTLLNQDEFFEHVRKAFERGLSHKLSGGRPYDEAADFLSDEEVAAIAKLPEGPIGDDVPRKEPVVHQSLRACKGLSSRYNREESLENIQRRYDRMLPIARFTIPRLAADPVVSRDLLSLKDDGWRDWQLMMAITTIVGNARPAWEGIELRLDTPPVEQHRANELIRREELPSDPELPRDSFTREKLESMLEFAALLVLPSYGLQSHARTPNGPQIIEVLRNRYRFGEDDVPHPDLFATGVGQAPSQG